MAQNHTEAWKLRLGNSKELMRHALKVEIEGSSAGRKFALQQHEIVKKK